MTANEHRLLVVGISWRTSPVAVREQIAFSDNVIPEALKTIKRFSGCHEAMILSTCNRVEIYVTTDDTVQTTSFLRDFLASFHDRDDPHFDASCYALEEVEAVKHIFRVTSGLDSMVVGENEILYQIKETYRLAAKEGAVGGKLALLVEQALKVGRDVRRKTNINVGAVSVATAACELAKKIFGKLTDRKVLILGTGKMGTETIKNLVRDGVGEIVIAARNKEKTEELARQFGAKAVDFSEWMRFLGDADIVIVSTGAPHYIVHAQDVKRLMVSRKHKPLFMIDIAVPRNVDPEIQQIGDVYLYNIDDLKGVCDSNIRTRTKEVRACEALIEPRVEQFFALLEKLKVGPTIEALNRKFDDIALHEFEELTKRWGSTPEQKDQIRHLISNIKGKFLHNPMSKLKEAAENGGAVHYTETIHRLFELDHREPESKK